MRLYEGETKGIGVSFNEEYDISNLLELEIVIKSKNNETVFAFKKTAGSLIQETNNTRIFKALLTNNNTKGKAGMYLMQFRIVDSLYGVKKSDLYEICIMKAIATEGSSINISSNEITHIFDITVDNELTVIGNYNINILGVSPTKAMPVVNKVSNDVMIHNLNCDGIRVSFFDSDGNQDFNFLWRRNITNSANEIVMLFPTDDAYNGILFIEKLF